MTQDSLRLKVICVLSLFFIVYCGRCGAQALRKKASCPDSCIRIKDCPEAFQMLQKPVSQKESEILSRSLCERKGTSLDNIKVCCNVIRTVMHPNLPLLPAVCGFSGGDRVISGKIADVLEFPWMALIKLQLRGEGFSCGGSVISDRYVLTAAHCLHNRTVVNVRVGEYDLVDNPDCQGTHTLICGDHYQDIDVEDVQVHEEYYNDGKIWKHDIALIRLKTPIDLSRNNARPICLPTSEQELLRELDGVTATVAGWGQTETGLARTLMKANLPIQSQTVCKYYFESISVASRLQTSTNTFLCAGVIGTDVCQRDSGGPLIVNGRHGGFSRYIQYGVVSFGDQKCGGSRPSLYSDVVLHMPWILDHLRP